MVELPFAAGSPYVTTDSWVLPSGATNFTAFVNCSTDKSQGACYFPNSTEVPALSNITLTLVDNVAPALSEISGTLANAAAHAQTVGGTQTFGFSAKDADSGVLAATLTLTPQGSGAPYTKTIASQCTYEAWNACPISQNVSPFTVPTAALKDGTYAVSLSLTDAAGNVNSESLGTIATDNAPVNTSLPSVLTPETVQVGSGVAAQPGEWTAPAEAGTIGYAYQWERCDSHGEDCAPITGAQSLTYTPTQGDQEHALRVQVTARDDDGATSAMSAPTSMIPSPEKPATTPPAPEPPSTAPGVSVPSTPAPSASASAGVSAGPGAPNGTPASETAQIRLSVPRTITRSYPQRALTITGGLLDTQEHPINGATLDVLEQTAGSGQSHVIAHARTGSDGSFAVHVPNGPSRAIQIAYRAFTNETGYAAQATISETVQASVKLTITPGHTRPTGTIILSGKVQGPIPHHGAIVELLVHYHGAWEPFRTPRTNSKGRFKVAYQFQGAIGRFPFRIKIPAGQANFPYTSGYSNTVNISTE
jgi:hypothetical protein